MTATTRQHDLFISYADADRSWVEDYLLKSLKAAGVNVHTRADFVLGVPSLVQFEQAVKTSRYTLLVLSPAYLAEQMNAFVDLLAQSYGVETRTWPVIPLILKPAELPPRLTQLESLDATDPADWQQVVTRLCDQLNAPISLKEVPLPLFQRQPWEPETVPIPAGAFLMGSPPALAIPPAETPQHELTLPAYRIGKFPVTVREFALFVKETVAVEWASSEVARSAGWFNLLPPKEKLDHPVTGVSWRDAMAYCAWLSEKTSRRYRLPSEAEWEKASRSDDRSDDSSNDSSNNSSNDFSRSVSRGTTEVVTTTNSFPWGEEWSEGRCNVASSGTTPVTAHPSGASALGCCDMLGNVQEWTCSLWGSQPQQADYGYPYDPADGREINDAAKLPAQARLVQRGGSYKSQPSDLRCTARGNAAPDSRIAWRGFRVAMTMIDS
jgi:formylglycine-generating enzyme required for sulfatase activity